jgi:hypothetical protein
MVRNFPQSRAVDKFSVKLAPRYRRPFKICQFLTPVTVRLSSTVDNSYCRAHPSIKTCVVPQCFLNLFFYFSQC